MPHRPDRPASALILFPSIPSDAVVLSRQFLPRSRHFLRVWNSAHFVQPHTEQIHSGLRDHLNYHPTYFPPYMLRPHLIVDSLQTVCNAILIVNISKQSLICSSLSPTTLAKIRVGWQDSQTPKWQNKVVINAVIFVDSLSPQHRLILTKNQKYQAPNRKNRILPSPTKSIT